MDQNNSKYRHFSRSVYPTIGELFIKRIPNVTPPGRLANFITIWEKIKLDQQNLSIERYEISFVSLPFQEKIANLTKISKEQVSLVKQEGKFREKGWRESSGDKFKKSEQIFFLRAFQ